MHTYICDSIGGPHQSIPWQPMVRLILTFGHIQNTATIVVRYQLILSTAFKMLHWQCMRRHQMETFSSVLALCAENSPATVEFPTQRPLTMSFAVFLDLSLNKLLSKQSRRGWFDTLSRSLWRHSNGGNHPTCTITPVTVNNHKNCG